MDKITFIQVDRIDVTKLNDDEQNTNQIPEKKNVNQINCLPNGFPFK